MSACVKGIAFVLLLCFLIPAVLRIPPIPLDVKIDSINNAVKDFEPFPPFPSNLEPDDIDIFFFPSFVNDWLNDHFANPTRGILAVFSWVYDVLRWFTNDIYYCLRLINAVCLNAVYTSEE